MFFKLFLISFLLVSLIMLTLSIKLLFNKNAEFTVHSCSTEPGADPGENGCHSCQLKDITNCEENENPEILKPLKS